MMILGAFVHDLDQVIIEFGPVQIRYYGVVFAATLLLGFLFWRKQMLRGQHSPKVADGFLVWGVLGTLIGARLGHCFFYNGGYYLSHPVEILFFWRGGLASHGATLGILVATILYAWKSHIHVIEMMDRLSFSAAIGSAGIRLGNFLNSEIVGRPTDVPWAVRFMHFSDGGAMARHPSQLYEFAMGLSVLGLLILADRLAGQEKRPLGLMAGLFFTLYFAGRFGVEFFKEAHTHLRDTTGLTMGQYLSIIPFLFGIGLLLWTYCKRIPTEHP
jgi:prolipoprotein diacylglyceryl transferase